MKGELNSRSVYAPGRVQLTGSNVVLTNNKVIVAKSDLKKINIDTYDGSGQVVHPSIVYIPKRFKGFRYWMAITPYPNSNDQYENPSIYCSDDGINWSVPTGLVNPITSIPAGGYNSDTHLMYDKAANQLICYYRPVVSSVEKLTRKTSTDGINWSAEVECVVPAGFSVTCPIVIKTASNKFILIGQRGGNFIYHESTDGINFSYVADTRMPIPEQLWHIGALKLDSGYVFTLCTLNAAEGNSKTSLYVGLSRSGQSVTYVSDFPILLPQGIFASQVYQSVITPTHNGDFRMYVSGMDADGKWNLGYVDIDINPAFPRSGVVDELNKRVTLVAGATSQIFASQPTYNAKEIRIMVEPDTTTTSDVLLLQDSSAYAWKKLVDEGYGDRGDVYKADLYSGRFSINLKNTGATDNTFKVKILLLS